MLGITSNPRRKQGRRVAVAEVKRTRSDLLQDLRVRKMLRYERGSTHCYLAATEEALRASKLTRAEILKDLTDKGLPKSWGVLLITSGTNSKIESIRNARARGSTTTQRINNLCRKIAKSYCYRVLGDKFS